MLYIFNLGVVQAGECDPLHASGDAADVKAALEHVKQPCASAVASSRCVDFVPLVVAMVASKLPPVWVSVLLWPSLPPCPA